LEKDSGFICGLARDDDRGDFTRGDIDLDRDFQRHADQNQFRHPIGTTYPALTVVQRTRGDCPEPLPMFHPISHVATAASD